MSKRLPPLTSLRAFEAAARHMSFAKAAEELNVTPAALSYQIKSLETDLGAALFRRLNRAVELTEIGRALAPGASDAFATLTAAWRNALRLVDTGVLNVTAGPAFTAKWLAPRLFTFAQEHPEIELRFHASLRIADFGRDDVDVAIRFGLGHDKDVYSRPLIQEWLTPMMTPELARDVTSPSDLNGMTLVHDESTSGFDVPSDWPVWCRAADVHLDTDHGPRFSQADHALDAAMEGAGVVLGRVSLAARALESGRLVAPIDIGLVAEPQFRFVCPEGHETRPNVAAFEAWVLKELESTKRWETGRTMSRSQDFQK